MPPALFPAHNAHPGFQQSTPAATASFFDTGDIPQRKSQQGCQRHVHVKVFEEIVKAFRWGIDFDQQGSNSEKKQPDQFWANEVVAGIAACQ